MIMELVPKQELNSRKNKLQDMMKNQGIDLAVIVGNTNLFYFAGSCQSGHLLIPVKGEPVYLVRKSFERAKEESMLEEIHPQKGFKSIAPVIEDLLAEGSGSSNKNKVIGMELDILPAGQYFSYEKLLSNYNLADISKEISFIRAIKSPYEVELIREAALIHNKMFDAVKEYLKVGISEVELSANLEAVFRKNGHQGDVPMRGFNQKIFYGHLMAGENLTYPSFVQSPTGGRGLSPAYPQGAGWKQIKKDEPVMVDHASASKGYIADQARIFCIGKLPDKMETAYEVTRTIMEEVKKTAQSGIHWSLIYNLAFEVAESEGFEAHFMGYGEDKTLFIGHGVGLELDELPVIAGKFDQPLEEGMVFALEPKMFFPGEGVVGLENTVVVKEDGLETLTSYPESIIYLEDH